MPILLILSFNLDLFRCFMFPSPFVTIAKIMYLSQASSNQYLISLNYPSSNTTHKPLPRLLASPEPSVFAWPVIASSAHPLRVEREELASSVSPLPPPCCPTTNSGYGMAGLHCTYLCMQYGTITMWLLDKAVVAHCDIDMQQNECQLHVYCRHAYPCQSCNTAHTPALMYCSVEHPAC